MLGRSLLGLGLLRNKTLGGMSMIMRIVLKGSLHELSSGVTLGVDRTAGPSA